MGRSQVYIKERHIHLLLKGNLHHPLFKSEEDYQQFLQILQRKQNQFVFKLLGYGLFTNHIHLIIEESSKGTLSSILHGLSLLYTKYYQKKYYINGPIFAGSYQSEIIPSKKELICRLRFIHQKPLHLGLSGGLNYTHSSFFDYCHPDQDSILDRQPLYRLFDKHNYTQAANLFKTIHYAQDDTKILDIDQDIFKKVEIAKKILKEELTIYHFNYDNIKKDIAFREQLVMKIHHESQLSQQEIADLLSISRHIVGRIIRFHRPN